MNPETSGADPADEPSPMNEEPRSGANGAAEAPRKRRKRRTKAQMAADRAIAAAFKRKRGRPSRADILARQALVRAAQSGIAVTDPANISAILAAQSSGGGAGGLGGGLLSGGPGGRSIPKFTKSKLKARRLNPGGDDTAAIESRMVGQHVEGVLDGTFDSGYFVTIRVGGTDTILRGVVFAPGVAAPLPWPHDAAPRVPKYRRNPAIEMPQ